MRAAQSRGNGGPHGRAPSRTRFEVASRSRRLLGWLHRQPAWLVPLCAVALAMLGMVLPPPWGGLCLLAIAAFLVWLAYLGWPRFSAGGRAVRVLVAGAVAGLAVSRIIGYGG